MIIGTLLHGFARMVALGRWASIFTKKRQTTREDFADTRSEPEGVQRPAMRNGSFESGVTVEYL